MFVDQDPKVCRATVLAWLSSLPTMTICGKDLRFTTSTQHIESFDLAIKNKSADKRSPHKTRAASQEDGFASEVGEE
jgi:hypothetical protein